MSTFSRSDWEPQVGEDADEFLAPPDVNELVDLCATDYQLFASTFFPKTCRKESPQFHLRMWAAMESLEDRFTAFKVFRGGAKTTLMRLFAAKRIAYAISRTIVVVGASEGAASRSILWLRNQVERNRAFYQTFGLRRGAKWSETELEIINGVDETRIYVAAVGITGRVRGINFEDYRPDLILADDLDDEETAGSPEQRKKAKALFFGALLNSLAGPEEATEPRMVLAQTPLDADDIVSTCEKSRMWRTETYGVFDEAGESRWPSLYPTEFLRTRKKQFEEMRLLSVWMRERECQVVSEERLSFAPEWLRPIAVRERKARTIIAIDPASSDSKKADELAMVVLGFVDDVVQVLDVSAARGVTPDRVSSQMFAWIAQYHPQYIVVETVAYQRILKWYLEQEMERQRVFVPVMAYDDKRQKSDRILQSLKSVAPHGRLEVDFARASQFVEQYNLYSPDYKGLVDVIDAAAIGISREIKLLHYPLNEDGSIEGEYHTVEVDRYTGKRLPAATQRGYAP
jgi:hypothetical protein